MIRDTFESPAFGTVDIPHEDEEKTLRELADRFPHVAFSVVNKKLNARGLCLLIDALLPSD